MLRRVFVILLFAAVLAACALPLPMKASPTSTSTAPPTATPSPTLAITPMAPQVGYLTLLHAEPAPAAALPIRPTLTFVFNQPLDRASLQAGWRFVDKDGKAVSGKVDWLNDAAFTFKPDKPLKPNGATYRAVFTSSLRAQNGSPLANPITLNYTTETALSVTAVYPVDGSDDVPLDADITVVFNKPVVPLTNRESNAAAPLPLKLIPQVEGTGRWVSSAVYVFHPNKPLKSNTDYQVALLAGVRDVEGDALARGRVWRFHTEFVGVNSISVNGWVITGGMGSDVPLKADIAIHFSMPMRPDVTEQAVTVTASNGGVVPSFTKEWDDDNTTLRLIPQDYYSLATTYTVSVNTTAQAADGGYLAKPAMGKFRTVGKPWVREVPEDQQDYSPWATIDFTTYMDKDSFDGKVVIQPTPTRGISLRVSGTSVNLGIFDPDTTYTVTFLPGIADVYGNETDAPITFTFHTAPLEPSGDALLLSDMSIFHADQPQVFYFRYANLDYAQFTIYPMDLQTTLSELVDWDDCSPEDAGSAPIGSKKVLLGANKDSRVHYLGVNLAEIAGHPLAPGVYCLEVEQSPKPEYSEGVDYYRFAVATESLVLKTSPANALAWATGVTSGAPAAGLKVEFYGVKDTDEGRVLAPLGAGTTNPDGAASVEGFDAPPQFAVINSGGHFAITNAEWTEHQAPESVSFWEVRQEEPVHKVAFIYTDRPLYRPGQQIFFKGILRQDDDLHYTIPHDTKVRVALYYENKLVNEQKVAVSELGTFHGSFLLADSAPVGSYSLVVFPTGMKEEEAPYIGEHIIRVANYHKPVFEVKLTPNPAEVAPGQESEITLQATYYAGDAVANADVYWRTSVRRFYFEPPRGYENYTFSNESAVPWLWGWNPQSASEPVPPQTGKGTTDAQGKFTFTVRAPKEVKDHDEQVLVWTQITDRGGNSASGHVALVSRLSDVYVGLKTDSWLGAENQPTKIGFVVLDPQGNPLANHAVHIKVFEEKWHSVQRLDASGVLRWESTLEVTPIADLGDFTTNADGRGEAQFTPPNSGTFRIVATAADAKGRVRKASIRFWVLGAEEALLWGETEAKTLPLIPDRAAYTPGDVAEIAIPRPFPKPVYALMTEERGKIYSYRLLRLDDPNLKVSVPITPRMAPVTYISVVVVSGGDAKNPPDYRIGTLRLPVALDRQRLNVTVTPDRPVAAPGETVHFTVKTTDYEGKPVPAEVSLAMVDKALLAIAPDTYNLLKEMYSERSLLVSTSVSLDKDALAYNLKAQRLLPLGVGMGGGGKGSDQGGVITVREIFRDTAFWKADVHTDNQGKAEISVTLPDNMTTWVVRARAVTADSRVGSATAEVRVNLPFFVRLHTPAFFTAGDKAVLNAVVHNSTDQHLAAEVTLSKAKGLQVNSPLTQKVDLPAKGQAVVSWQVVVPLDSRRVDLEVQASAGNYHDATRPTLTLLPDGGIPVFAYTTVQAVGTGGVLFKKGSVREFVLPPKDASHYKLRLNLAASLTASVAARLNAKPQEPSECVPSNAFALMRDAAILRMRATLYAKAPQNDSAKTDAAKRLQALLNYQHTDGGWGWCNDSVHSDVMPTAYALDALQAARAAGLPVDASQISRPAEFVSQALVRPQRRKYLTLDEQAYIVDVLARAGRPAATTAYSIAKEAKSGKLSTAGWAMLLRAAENMNMGVDFTKPIADWLENRVTTSAAGAHWDGGNWWSEWGSSLTTTALAADALLKADPNAPFMPNVVRWIVARYNASPTISDLSDITVLRTLSDWAEFSHENAADYDYGVFIGGKPTAAGRMSVADSQKPRVLSWDGKALPAGKLTPLDIQRGDGKGALYYSAYLEISQPAGDAHARYDGFSVDRAYYRLPDLEKPVTSVKSGDLVQVRLTVVVPHSEDNVVLTDYLPAGLEPLSEKESEFMPQEQNFSPKDFWRYGWGGWWFGHREVYYDRVVFHASHLEPGTYTLVYYARAAVPGVFQTRPAVVWDSFFPDVRGNTAGAVFTVIAR